MSRLDIEATRAQVRAPDFGRGTSAEVPTWQGSAVRHAPRGDRASNLAIRTILDLDHPGADPALATLPVAIWANRVI